MAGYVTDFGELAPGDLLMICLEDDGDVSIDYANAERDVSEFLRSQEILFVEVTRILRVDAREKED